MIITIILTLIVIAAIALVAYINSAPKPPAHTDKVVEELLDIELPELVGEGTGYAKSGDLKIWYEVIQPSGKAKGTVLLVMGHASTALLWPPHFFEPLVAQGYQVIRYDNRDVGMSTWIKDYDKSKPYSLEDMAKDGIAVLDAIGVDKVHVIGASMGGMIAQRMAISHDDRVLTLTSIMSSGYMMDPDVAPIPKSYLRNFLKLGVKYHLFGGKAGPMKFFVTIHNTLRGDGPYELNVAGLALISRYEIEKRRGFNREAIENQARAIEVSGSRLDELENLSVPTLIVHGKADPLVIFAHAERYAPRIPHAETLFIDGMGHDIPELYLGRVHEAVLGVLENN